MSVISRFLNGHIGLRTIYKSLVAYNKGNAGLHNRPLDALLIDGRTKLTIRKNAQIINKGSLKIGLDPMTFYPSQRRGMLTMLENSKLILNGDTLIGRGVIIEIHKDACLEIGHHVFINSDATIVCAKSIKIGSYTGIGWDTEICETDYHRVGDRAITEPIEIGNKVYIGRRIMILKGVKIGDGSAIAAGAIVTRNVPPKSLAGGIPARVIKENIEWEE
jgi:acetyltransferase-like isoleucine patch superfamily enzyme